MKTKYFTIALVTLLVLSCSKDDGDPSPPITFDDGEFPEKILVGNWRVRTQSEVDAFGAMNYTIITGGLKIDPTFETGNFALDLTPLRSLERIENTLIITDNPTLESLEGLHNINWLGELFIQDNPSLKNLDGLRGLRDIAYEVPNPTNGLESSIWIRNNASLENIDGINQVPSATHITIANNPSLQNLDGLQSIIENEYLRTDIGCDSQPYVPPYCGNESLTDLCGLRNLFVNGTYDYVRIAGNAFNPTIQDIIDGNCSE